MAIVLKASVGSSFSAQFRYQQPDGSVVDTTGKLARFQLRTMSPPVRVILNTVEWTGTGDVPDGTTLVALEPGVWRLFLGKTVVSSLPSSVLFELELSSTTNPEDSIVLADGVIKIDHGR